LFGVNKIDGSVPFENMELGSRGWIQDPAP
jgi:hypothetical protein